MNTSVETILLVDDNDALRSMASLVLRKAGYRVLEAADGAQALRLCKEPEETVDLLLSDIVMPEIDGYELADTVRLMRPEIKVLLMSGHSDEVSFASIEASAFLPKPFTPRGLVQKVREVLSGGNRQTSSPQHGSWHVV